MQDARPMRTKEGKARLVASLSPLMKETALGRATKSLI